jgi:hypothetical protein
MEVSDPFIVTCNLEIKDTPGPGTYKIPSAFDKFKRLPPKEYLLLKGEVQAMESGRKSASGERQNNLVIR